MTTVVECIMDNGKIRPLDQDKLGKWKEKHKQGQVFDMVLDDHENQAMSPLARKYFAIRDEYAALNGYSKEDAHVELKALFGVTTARDGAPVGRLGRVVNYHGNEMWQLSVKDYSVEELQSLVMRTEKALMEAGV